jgi:hypothetical protein
MSSGPPYPEVEGWKRVGGGRLEGPGYMSTDFDLLLLEQVLNDHDIRCQFLPHRPGEGLGVGREGFTGVALYVPDDRYEEAAALAEELASAELVEEGDDDVEGDDVEDDLGDVLSAEETGR